MGCRAGLGSWEQVEKAFLQPLCTQWVLVPAPRRGHLGARKPDAQRHPEPIAGDRAGCWDAEPSG